MCFGELEGSLELDIGDGLEEDLSDTVLRVDSEGFGAEVNEEDMDVAAEVGVDGGRGIEDSQAIF